ncbi:MAG: sigma-54 dependent transcriptional regulator [Gemmatimonadota bacterium]|nr:sigma-54 dependent transcriptional regulator [Gemmatimonadota bacterium]
MRDENARGDAAPRILVVEDEDNVRDLLLTVLGENGYRVEAVRTGEEGLQQLDSQLYDLVLLDLNLPGMHGLNVLGAGPALQTDAQFIVMTAFGSIDSAVEAMKLGAVDFIKKPFRTEELLHVLARAMEELELKREVAQLRSQSSSGVRSYLVGKSQAMQRVLGLIERVAPTRANVLITGDTGTGKELVARAVHELSGRSRRPFVAINCSALPETLLESEMFGHMKGSFTGAVQSKRGLFEEAQGGSIFLDEISTVTEPVQIKLLRVLQERKVTRVGGREPIAVDFRLIAATNRDLGELVEKGEFREDLFYRLNVFPVRVPPLRERRDDVPLLAQHFRQRFAEENDLEPPDIPPKTMARLMAYDWPGNVRELENFIERAVIMHAGARAIPFEPPGQRPDPERNMLTRAREEKWDLERLEREYILEILEQTQWHQSSAADALGISRRTLYRKLRRYKELGILPESPHPGLRL